MMARCSRQIVARRFVRPATIMATLPLLSSRILDAYAFSTAKMFKVRGPALMTHQSSCRPQFSTQMRLYVEDIAVHPNGLAPTASPILAERLQASQLRWKCDPDQFRFATTAELTELEGSALLGQGRAESAIEFGLGMNRAGYNLYVLGPPGSGKRSVIQRYLEQHVKSNNTTLFDWCYVYNFEDYDKPKALRLPAGTGRMLQKDMIQLIEDLKNAIPAALEAEDHVRRLEQAEKDVLGEYEQNVDVLAEEVKRKGLELIRTPNGVALLVPNEVERNKLTPEKKKEIDNATEEMQPKLRELVQTFQQALKVGREKIKELNQETARSAIEFLTTPLKKPYSDLPDVVEYLDSVEADAIEHVQEFQPTPKEAMPFLSLVQKKSHTDNYLVNLFIDHSESVAAPVVYEDHPYYHNLVGRVEHESRLGSLSTDFSLIKPGALHRANGGYLVLQARDVLMQPFSWEALKRALRSGTIHMESLGDELSLISTVSLQPEPIPLDVKVVLLGDRRLYYLLQAYDEDFGNLFKVEADFNDETDRSIESCQLYAQMLATLSKTDDARPLDREAVALMIEQAARHVSDQEKLSTHMRMPADLLRESDYWAGVDGADVIGAPHVSKAIEQQIYRADRIRELVHEQIRRGTLLVDIEGERIGQVNGLSVMALGNLAFGRPSRITATGRLGRGKVVDIEREVELGGSIHSKGIMILSSLLASRYARDCPLSLTASLVFEQSYGMVDGDSASVAEFCALLSVLSDIPIRQSLAITGSLNQYGEAQPIGGVNEKIEGFYDVCKAKGLTGDQGVLIPISNVKHLMLRPDILEAVDNGEFAVWTYENVDDAMTLLTGVDAGTRNSDGEYPVGSINYRVDRRLHELADLMVSFGEKSNGDQKLE